MNPIAFPCVRLKALRCLFCATAKPLSTPYPPVFVCPLHNTRKWFQSLAGKFGAFKTNIHGALLTALSRTERRTVVAAPATTFAD
jgi:hypothetical protein